MLDPSKNQKEFYGTLSRVNNFNTVCLRLNSYIYIFTLLSAGTPGLQLLSTTSQYFTKQKKARPKDNLIVR